MSQKTFFFVAGLIFLVIGLLHVARIIFQWEAMIGGWEVPLWLSWVALPVAFYLGFHGVKYSKRI